MNRIRSFFPFSARRAVLAMLVSTVVGARAREFVVSPAGDDTGAGTPEAPFATVSRAQQALREAKAAGAGGPFSILLRGGTHVLTEPLVFEPADSGSPEFPVNVASFPGERAVLSGGRRLEGEWRRTPGKPYLELTVPGARDGGWVFHSLYVNGTSRIRARTPNWGDKVFRAEGRAPEGDPRQSFRYSPGDIDAAWTNPTDVDLVLLCSWTPTIHRIAQIDPQRRTVRFSSSHSRAVDFWERRFRYYAANVFEALDRPGEWYLNRRTGVLYVYPLPGEDLSTAEVIAPVLRSRLVTIRGNVEKGEFVGHLRFRNLTFAHTDGDMERYNGAYRQGHMYLGAGLYAEGWRHGEIVDCELAHLGEYALELGPGCRDNAVRGCHIWDIGAGAMQIGVTDLGTLLGMRQALRPDDAAYEAEAAAVTAPFAVVRDEQASGGGYVVLPAGEAGGAAAFDIRVPQPGRYRFLARVFAADGTADSFVVRIDDGPPLTYDTGTASRWFLSQVVARESEGRPVEVDWDAGAHTVTISGREAGARLDRLILRRVTAEDDAAGEYPGDVLRNTIDNNCIHRLGTIWHGSYGIVNRFASFTKITHNDMFDMHWDAIGLDARWTYNGELYSRGNEVAYNRLHHLGLRYHTDAAGVYQFGPLDTHIHHNIVHDTVAYPYICGYSGIYLDEQSRNALVENNLVYNLEWSAYLQNKGVDNTFRNNIGAFARDGFFHRGGLDTSWRANHFQAYRNIYLSRDSSALGKGWQKGERPPELGRNTYFSLTTGTDVTFAGKSFADWQADGYDGTSRAADPGFVDPEHADFRLRPDSSAAQELGFVPFEEEWAKVGLYGPPEWTGLPGRCERRTPSAVWTAEDLARLVAFAYDFEDYPEGARIPGFNLAEEGDATFAVVSGIAASGDKSLRCTDRKGLKKTFYPYVHLAPRGLTSGRLTFAMDAMVPAEGAASFVLEFRGVGFVDDVGPTLQFGPDGSLSANGMPLLPVPPGTWRHLEIRFELGAETPREYVLTSGGADGASERRIPFRHDTFSEVRWLGITAPDDADGVFYLDNMRLELE